MRDDTGSPLGSLAVLQNSVFLAFAFCAALAMAGCAPKAPPAATVNPKPQSTAKYDSLVSEQHDLKIRLDAQMNAMLALQEHMAALEDRMSMLEQGMNHRSTETPVKTTHVVRMHTHPKPVERHPLPHVKPVLSAPHDPAVKPISSIAERQLKPIVSRVKNDHAQDDFDAVMLLLKHGDYEKAAMALAQFVKKYPGSEQAPKARYWLGEAMFAQEDFMQVTDALRPFESMPVATPKRALALFRLGASYQRIGRNTDAIRAFRILRRDYPGSAEASNAARQLKSLDSDLPKSPTQPTMPVVPSPTPPVVKKPPARSESSQKWAVNIVSIENLTEAKHLLDRLHARGFHAKMMDVKVKGMLWHRLYAPGYASREKAEHARKVYVRKGFPGAWTSPE